MDLNRFEYECSMLWRQTGARSDQRLKRVDFRRFRPARWVSLQGGNQKRAERIEYSRRRVGAALQPGDDIFAIALIGLRPIPANGFQCLYGPKKSHPVKVGWGVSAAT